MKTVELEQANKAIAIIDAQTSSATVRGDFNGVAGLAVVRATLQLVWQELEALRPKPAAAEPPPALPPASPVAEGQPDTSEPPETAP